MIAALLDTDTVIALLRGNPPLERKVRSHRAGSLGISMITVYELQVGVEKSNDPVKNARLLRDALAPFVLLPFDEAASAASAKVRAHLEQKGKGIGPYDTLIAGHALSRNSGLVTANTREFKRVPGLKQENWAA